MDSPDPRLVALIEATTSALAQRVTDLETTHEALTASVGVVRADLDQLKVTVGGNMLAESGDSEALHEALQRLAGRVTDIERDAKEHLDALGASVGVVRADVTALQGQEPVRVLLARIETLSDERNAARRSQMEVAAERDALRRAERVAREDLAAEARRNLETLAARARAEAERDAALAVLTRVRAGDLVRCATCEGRGHCADCEDEHGEARYGVPGLVPSAANAPLPYPTEEEP